MKKSVIEQTGITEEGKKVISFFKMYDTLGLPVVDILDSFNSNNIVPDFYTFSLDAKKAGWSIRKINSLLKESVQDVFGNDYWLKVEKQLKGLNVY